MGTYDDLRMLWRHWLDHEMGWLDKKVVPIYSTGSNHNNYDLGSEAVFREVFPNLPWNGPTGREGLAYWVRQKDFLLVCVDTHSALKGPGLVHDLAWLDEVLSQHADAKYKFVAGHHPVFTVNGYDNSVQGTIWRVWPDEGEAFWKILVKYHVIAYLCSHIIAFDVQVHGGVLHICTGGAGTPLEAMSDPAGKTEYYHFVQMAVDPAGLRYHVIDTTGRIREALTWPMEIPPVNSWDEVPRNEAIATAYTGKSVLEPNTPWILFLHFSGTAAKPEQRGQYETLLAGWDDRPTAFWVGLEGASPTVTLRLAPVSGEGPQAWRGPILSAGEPFDFQIAVHTGMGPGGIMWRKNSFLSWSSFRSWGARGAERMIWPKKWTVGFSRKGENDNSFKGDNLRVAWKIVSVPSEPTFPR